MTPAPSPEAMPHVPAVDDLAACVAAAQADLAAAGEAGPLRRDPYRLVLAGLSGVLGVFLKSIRRWEQAVSDVIAARDPLPAEERAALAAELVEATERGAFQAMRKEAARMVRTMDRGLAVRMGLYVGGAYVAGALTLLCALMVFQLGPFSRQAEGAAAWRELEQHNPDPRPALATAEVRTDRATGRRYYAGVSLWIDPSRPPPVAPAPAKPQGNQ